VKTVTAAEVIVDASVVAKFHFQEDGSDRARDFLTSGAVIGAPELLVIEIASVAAKLVQRGFATPEQAQAAMVSLGDLVDEFIPMRTLGPAVLRMARDCGCSAYDATYLVVARDRGLRVVSADLRLIERARASGLGASIEAL